MNGVFFEKSKKFLTQDDLLLTDADISLSKCQNYLKISSLSSIDKAQSGDLTFFTKNLVSGDKYIEPLRKTKASYCLIKKEFEKIVPENIIPIFTEEPQITFNALYNILYVEKIITGKSNIADSAKISKSVSIGEGVEIGENVIIEDFVKIGNGVKIGENTIIKANATIENNCIIGNSCIIRENSTIKFSIIGDECIIYSGARIGEDGFGFVFDSRTKRQSKINHYGAVVIGNRVEVGANSCIDRGTFDDTIIEDDVKIDNLVQIGHNVKIGSNSVLAGQVGIAGSAEIGKNCMFGGKSGMVGHIKLSDNCKVIGTSSITKNFKEGSIVFGTPAELHTEAFKKMFFIRAVIRKYDKFVDKNRKKSFFEKLIMKLLGIK